MWKVEFLNDKVEKEFLELPNHLQAKGFILFGVLEARGNNIGEPITKSLGGGLFELRIKADGDIARSIYFYEIGKRIIILASFVKKTQKTPNHIIDLAKQRLKDYKNGNN